MRTWARSARSAWNVCPCTCLKQMVGRAERLGLRVEAAFEYEFYLAREVDGQYVPADDSLCFASDGMDGPAEVIGGILDALD